MCTMRKAQNKLLIMKGIADPLKKTSRCSNSENCAFLALWVSFNTMKYIYLKKKGGYSSWNFWAKRRRRAGTEDIPLTLKGQCGGHRGDMLALL